MLPLMVSGGCCWVVTNQGINKTVWPFHLHQSNERVRSVVGFSFGLNSWRSISCGWVGSVRSIGGVRWLLYERRTDDGRVPFRSRLGVFPKSYLHRSPPPRSCTIVFRYPLKVSTMAKHKWWHSMGIACCSFAAQYNIYTIISSTAMYKINCDWRCGKEGGGGGGGWLVVSMAIHNLSGRNLRG